MEICGRHRRVYVHELQVEIYSWKFPFPYQTLSDLCEPKTIQNHFLRFKIHEKIAFRKMLRSEKYFPLHQHPWASPTEEKSMPKVFLLSFCLDGWMAEWQMDRSRFELHNLKLLWCSFWITNTSGKCFFKPRVVFCCRKIWTSRSGLQGIEHKMRSLEGKSDERNALRKGLQYKLLRRRMEAEEITQIDELYHRFAQLRASIVLRVSFWKTLFLISFVNSSPP